MHPRSNSLEGSVTSFNRSVQILLGVRKRKEPGFKLGRGKIDSLLHHLNKEMGKSLRIAHLGSAIVPDRPFSKEESKHPCRSIDRERNLSLLRTLRNILR